jgi:hypothetical protein
MREIIKKSDPSHSHRWVSKKRWTVSSEGGRVQSDTNTKSTRESTSNGTTGRKPKVLHERYGVK